MSQYCARVAVPKLLPSGAEDGGGKWTNTEVMVDSIQANSMRKARKSALAEARRYQAWLHPNYGDRIPAPEIIKVSRVDPATGKPLEDSFLEGQPSVTVRMKSGATDTSKRLEVRPQAQPHTVVAPSGAVQRVSQPAVVVVKYITDPLIETVIEQIKENASEQKQAVFSGF